MAVSLDRPYMIRIESPDFKLYTTAKYYFKSFGFNVTDDKNIKNVVYVTDTFIVPKTDEKGFYIIVKTHTEIDLGRDSRCLEDYNEARFTSKDNFYTPDEALNSLIELPTKLFIIYSFSNSVLNTYNNERRIRRRIGPNTTQLHF